MKKLFGGALVASLVASFVALAAPAGAANSATRAGVYANKATYTDADASWIAPRTYGPSSPGVRVYVSVNLGHGTTKHPEVRAGTFSYGGQRSRAFIAVSDLVQLGPWVNGEDDTVYAHVVLRPDGTWSAKVVDSNPYVGFVFQNGGRIAGTSPDGHASWVVEKIGTQLPRFESCYYLFGYNPSVPLQFCSDIIWFQGVRAAYAGHWKEYG